VTNSPLGVSVLPLAELVEMIERLSSNVKSGTGFPRRAVPLRAV
jgi:hypothetical protein